MSQSKAKPSKLETIKDDSRQLRGHVADDLAADSSHFDENGKQILKFHGLYQQDDRDQRKARRAAKQERAYQFMLRTRIPGGKLTADQYLVHDDLAGRFGNGTLRITTRQCFQLHGVLKGDIKSTIQELNETLITSLGACGDLVRNVMCCPSLDHDHVSDAAREQIEQVTRQISDHLLPRTRAYHELWLDGEKVYGGLDEPGVQEEPIYGKTYLPRKFKIGIAYPGDNCIDIYTQDIGLVAIVHGDELLGFNVIVGGGMGMNHTKANTFPRLGDPLAFVPPPHVVKVVETIVKIQRDYGNRSDRQQARMKYLIHNWGLERFRNELESRLGYQLQNFAPMPPFENELHLGWREQGDGRWSLGVSVENGRIKDEGKLKLRTGLRRVVENFRPGVRLTPNHDVLLTDIPAEQREIVDAMLRAFGIDAAESLSQVQRYSMACPALPTCGLAVAESERALPGIIDELEAELAALRLQNEPITVRMTGCPNGCARPYVADIAFVGRSADQYVLFVGGRNDGTRLNQPFRDLVHRDDLVPSLRPLLARFGQARLPGETFGDFCHRHGVEALQRMADAYVDSAKHREVEAI